MPKTLRLILGDQLNQNHSWYKEKSNDITYVMMEMRQETDYVNHHIQKVLGFFAAMRAFKSWLAQNGHNIIYLTIDDPDNQHNLPHNLSQIIKEKSITLFQYQLPDEYRLDEQLSEFCDSLEIDTSVCDTEHFLTERSDLQTFFKGKKTYLMESFYRHMRKQYDIMMEGDQPLTGQWNYDQDNRKKLPKNPELPERLSFDHDLTVIYKTIQNAEVKTIGTVDPANFRWPITREESLAALEHFLEKCLPNFGTYQDAMHTEHRFVNHSLISFALNTKMLHPLEVVTRAIEYWEENKDDITIAQIEGFVRQIIGWREFMRGVYWAHMPEYASKNALNHQRKLPDWFWTGDTKMNCLSHAINQSLEEAYAHHIQRLMVTGNFALLAGIDPNEVDTWYLGIYIDAIEWVEITNTRGMSQFADGGIVGTKPYVSSANYISKMSNYCDSCHYAKSKKTGEKACPFNSLYWHFYERHRDKFEKNPRIGMMYRTLSKMKNKDEILDQAEYYLNTINEL